MVAPENPSMADGRGEVRSAGRHLEMVAPENPSMADGRGDVPERGTQGPAALRIVGEPRVVFRLHRRHLDWPFVVVTVAFFAAASLLILLAH